MDQASPPAKMSFLMTAWTPQLPSTTWVMPKSAVIPQRTILFDAKDGVGQARRPRQMSPCRRSYSQPRRLPRSGNLLFYNRGTWIQSESPNRGTDHEETSCINEWRLPRSELNQDTKDN